MPKDRSMSEQSLASTVGALRITPFLQRYAWGSTSALQEFLSLNVDGHPLAEAWFGSHSSGPSVADLDGTPTPLDVVFALHPTDWFEPTDAASNTLSFLLKILAIGAPLSLQLHPTKAQAEVGFSEEMSRGVDIGAPNRVFRDQNHKPELICALTEMDALCGFRPLEATLELLAGLGGTIAKKLIAAINASVDEDVLRNVIALALDDAGGVLGQSVEERHAATNELGKCAESWLLRDCPELFRLSAQWIAKLAKIYPGDGGVAVACLLHCIRIQPGEALFLSAGNMHAYLDGLGVEIMANSDNVVRGGLTSKHVDTKILAELVDTRPVAIPLVYPVSTTMVGGATREDWLVPVSDFALCRIRVNSNHGEIGSLAAFESPAIVLCATGAVDILVDTQILPDHGSDDHGSDDHGSGNHGSGNHGSDDHSSVKGDQLSFRLLKGDSVIVAPGRKLQFFGIGECFVACGP
jgi:mannose-6-phosphate isomerase